MNRFGKVLVALIVLALIGLASITRFVPARPKPAARAPASGPASGAPASDAVTVAPLGPSSALHIPVVGVTPAQLVDTWGDARGQGRMHDAIDIAAPRGTPVLAATAGRVEKLFESDLGGHTLYIRSPDGAWVTYYAHLDHYAPGVREGMSVAAGQPIAAVGSSGDASAEGPHLHFEVKRMAAGQKWYEGEEVNPYPLLAGNAARR